MKNHRGKEFTVRHLDEGDHFGEISMIYGCKRSATVYSMNYNTFAWMNRTAYKRLIQDYPEYETCLRRFVVREYWDLRTKFLIQMVKRVEYLDQAADDIVFDIVFSLEQKFFDKDQMILAQNSNIKEIYFIEEGEVQVETEFDFNPFVIDKLGPGSVINYRAVFLKDEMYVNIKALTEVKVLSLPFETLMTLVAKHGEQSGSDRSKAAID